MESDPIGSRTPGSRFGPYEVLSRLGAGGMGEVYLARDHRLGRDVALKVLPASRLADADHRARFEREARALAALSHPSVAVIYGLEEFGDTQVIVQEYVDGETLADRVASGPLPIREAAAIAADVAGALSAAHGKGIVHRDLKPANVMVTKAGVVKVLDFGLARILPAAGAGELPTVAAVTQRGVIVGTTAYMSPEQLRGHAVDGRTDVWAFGCLLFELLSGARPFDGGTSSDLIAAILEKEPNWDRLPSRTPAPVRKLLQLCLEKDAIARPPDLADARALLESVRTEQHRRAPIRPWAIAAGAMAVAIVAALAGRGLFTHLSAPVQIQSVAVLPLVDLSAKPDEDYFTNGMTDELIGALAKIRSWRVISRTSVMQYKGATKPLTAIAGELGVDALVEGTVQRVNDRVRISVRLVRAGAAEEDLWSQRYDRGVRDVLDLQAEVASAIAAQIRLTLSPGEQERLAARHPIDPEALQLYLKGKAAADAGTEDGIARGLKYFEQALDRSPSYAPAHAAMALAYGNLTPAYRAPKDVMPKSREHAVRAIELDDTLSEAHTALARIMFMYDWDFPGAEKEMKHAIDLNPSSADAHELYGNYLVATEDKSKAISELQVARELNPTALTTYASLLAAYVTLRMYDPAIAEGRKAVAAHPDFAFAHAWLGMALVMKGQVSEALPILKRARDLDNNVSTTHMLAIAQAAAGNRAEATRLADALAAAADSRYTCAYEVSSVFLALGETDKAFQWVRRGFDERCDCMVWLRSEPWMDPMRIDARYADLVKRVGFTR